jgi:hypothetical protein
MVSQAANVFEFSSNTYLEACLALFKSNNRWLDQYFTKCFAPVNSLCGYVCVFFGRPHTDFLKIS